MSHCLLNINNLLICHIEANRRLINFQQFLMITRVIQWRMATRASNPFIPYLYCWHHLVLVVISVLQPLILLTWCPWLEQQICHLSSWKLNKYKRNNIRNINMYRSSDKKTTTYALLPPGKLMSNYSQNKFQDSCKELIYLGVFLGKSPRFLESNGPTKQGLMLLVKQEWAAQLNTMRVLHSEKIVWEVKFLITKGPWCPRCPCCSWFDSTYYELGAHSDANPHDSRSNPPLHILTLWYFWLLTPFDTDHLLSALSSSRPNF